MARVLEKGCAVFGVNSDELAFVETGDHSFLNSPVDTPSNLERSGGDRVFSAHRQIMVSGAKLGHTTNAKAEPNRRLTFRRRTMSSST